MLIPVEDYLKESGVYQMSLNKLVDFKNKVRETIKCFEDNKYTEDMLIEEVFMSPSVSAGYGWNCSCLIEVCLIILSRQECNEGLKKACKLDIGDAYIKAREGLYGDRQELIRKFREIKGDIFK